ncbi:MAG: hypothetical protein C4334_01875 [Pyrinomonas sp.]|uniref:YCF48-related protein n=1 Tax=Pyrinomonas sp. TaxID=2080306 RepID=UPI003327902D
MKSLIVMRRCYSGHDEFAFCGVTTMKRGWTAFALLCSTFILSAVVSRGDWRRQPSGTMTRLRAVFFVDERRGFVVGGNGAVLMTEDGGATWRLQRRPNDDALRDVLFVGERIGWMLAERNPFALRSEGEPRSYFWRSEDGGTTWLRLNPVGIEAVILTRIIFADEMHGWTFGEGGTIYATRDGGKSWSRQFAPTRYLLLGGASYGAQRAWIVGAGSTALYTTDSGDTWQLGTVAEAGVRLNGVHFIDERRGWAVGSGGRIFATVNGGKSWRRQNAPTAADLFDVRFRNAREGWAVGDDGTILHTADGGATWTVAPSVTKHRLERLFIAPDGRAWAVGFGGTIVVGP